MTTRRIRVRDLKPGMRWNCCSVRYELTNIRHSAHGYYVLESKGFLTELHGNTLVTVESP